MLPTWVELRIALRTLRRRKAFARFSILALAIAANTTMSSLIDGLVRAPSRRRGRVSYPGG